MLRIKLLTTFTLCLLSLALTGSFARADWTLDQENSQLSYASIKKGSIGENNHFQKLDGRITDAGEITLLIDLASVETWVDIRNARMKEFFFKTLDFPVATLRGQIDMAKFNDLKVGSQQAFDLSFDFDLHGQSQTIDAELVIMRLSEKTVVVIPGEFIFLDVKQFNLLAGLKKLQELAKLPSISSVVPIVFHLTFTQVP
ncbi:MAG: polyisoprenoid-binding protein [Alphaproteobacteria bacterium]|nr:MAG: polyisoprenoid-binding protein [Alphaproteobacteria bacterium]